MQIKTTTSYHFTLAKMTIIQNKRQELRSEQQALSMVLLHSKVTLEINYKFYIAKSQKEVFEGFYNKEIINIQGNNCVNLIRTL